MKQTKRGPAILILTIFMTMAACYSFPAASLAQGSSSDVGRILNEISDYDYGQSREQLSALRMLVQSSLDSEDSRLRIEKEMTVFLESDATFAGKQFVCEQLSLIGTDASIPVLTKLLSDEQTADIALYALQRIPGTAVDEALRESLAKVDGKARIGIINALGERKCAKAVRDIGSLIYNADPQTGWSAVTALGKIATRQAAGRLSSARYRISHYKMSDKLLRVVLDAYLSCADSLYEQGRTKQAVSIYRTLYDEETLTHIRAAALRGLVQTGGDGAADIVLSGLKSDDPKIQSVAVGLVRELPETTDLNGIIAGDNRSERYYCGITQFLRSAASPVTLCSWLSWGNSRSSGSVRRNKTSR